jgi:predicted phage terminase large subunit-like protein
VILASYEADFAAEWGRKARSILEEHGGLFGVQVSTESSAADRWDIAGHDGGMRTAGVGGPITGKGADVLIVDDPVKNFADAHSETIRERTWNWWTSTAYTRLEPNGSAIIIQTRWHEEDLAGRVLRELTHDNWQEIRFPAIAEAGDPLGRKPGEALWPARFNAARLEAIRKTIGQYQFSALYQQRPTAPEGEMFKRHWFEYVDAAPADADRCRSWDKGGTAGGGDPSAGVLVAKKDGIYYIEDVERGQWGAFEREKIIKSTADHDAARYGTRKYGILIEQEPGSGGKHSAEITVKALAGYDVHAERSTGEKEVRARPLAAQAEAGNVKIVRGKWNRDFVDELCSFPTGVHDDQVDAAAGGFNRLALVQKLKFWVY